MAHPIAPRLSARIAKAARDEGIEIARRVGKHGGEIVLRHEAPDDLAVLVVVTGLDRVDPPVRTVIDHPRGPRSWRNLIHRDRLRIAYVERCLAPRRRVQRRRKRITGNQLSRNSCNLERVVGNRSDHRLGRGERKRSIVDFHPPDYAGHERQVRHFVVCSDTKGPGILQVGSEITFVGHSAVMVPSDGILFGKRLVVQVYLIDAVVPSKGDGDPLPHFDFAVERQPPSPDGGRHDVGGQLESAVPGTCEPGRNSLRPHDRGRQDIFPLGVHQGKQGVVYIDPGGYHLSGGGVFHAEHHRPGRGVQLLPGGNRIDQRVVGLLPASLFRGGYFRSESLEVTSLHGFTGFSRRLAVMLLEKDPCVSGCREPQCSEKTRRPPCENRHIALDHGPAPPLYHPVTLFHPLSVAVFVFARL